MTGKGRHDEAREGSWLEGIPFLRSEWLREMDLCRHKGKPKGCSYAHEQSEIDEVNARRKAFVRQRLAQKGWPCLLYNELNMFELNGTPMSGPAHV
eukprot:3039842-Heterocapsa_arctica.AAC.1